MILIAIYLIGYFLSCISWNIIFIERDSAPVVAELIIGGLVSVLWPFVISFLLAYALVRWRKNV